MQTVGASLPFYLSRYEDMESLWLQGGAPPQLADEWATFQRVRDRACAQAAQVVEAAAGSMVSAFKTHARFNVRTRTSTARKHWNVEGHLLAPRRRYPFGWAGTSIDPFSKEPLCIWICFNKERRIRAQLLADHLLREGVRNVSLGAPPIFPNPGLVIVGRMPLNSDSQLRACADFAQQVIRDTLLPHWQEFSRIAELVD